MGNTSIPSFDKYNQTKNLSLEQFQKETPRKMTIHILSNKEKDCIEFVEFITKEKINSTELLEKNIEKKINLYSFMNYKVYEDAKELMNQIKKVAEFVSKNLKSENAIYSEMIIILDNDEINNQIDAIKNIFEDDNEDNIFNEPYYIPFLLILSPRHICLSDFLPSKTFQYKITLEKIFQYFKKKGKEKQKDKKEKEEKDKELEEFFSFIRKLNVIFSYYNELGDEFSFINSKGDEQLIKLEDEDDISVFVNIILLGRSGCGKSTLINLILNEKKSLEGGIGTSTTSKNILVYKKTGLPVRFYDVKGIESQKSLDNYVNILKDFGANSNSNDYIHDIFYCIEYKKNGTIIEEMENSLFEELINFNIPIIFIITKAPFDPSKVNTKGNSKTKTSKKNITDRYRNAIHSLINNVFKNKGREEESKNFIEKYVRIHFVNLVRDYTSGESPIPIFGIDKVLSYFKESVPERDWEELKKACFLSDEEKCIKLCQNNLYLKIYSDFTKLKETNKIEAENYLKGLKAGAFFTGMVPGLDIGMEYLYRNKFTKKLISLYGFDYEQAKEALNDNHNNLIKKNDGDNEESEIILDEEETNSDSNLFKNSINNDDDERQSLKMCYSLKFETEELVKRMTNSKKEVEEVKSKISDNISNVGKNTGSVIRGLGEAGSIALKIVPTAGRMTLESGEVIVRAGISAGLKIASWVLLPVTCIGFGAWSLVKVHKDCNKIMDIFEQAFTPLRFKTLYNYIKSFKKTFDDLDNIGKKIIEDDKKND